MSIRQCRAVRAITEHGSFAAAAKALDIGQSAISMQITSFEERLGVTLFDRAHRPPRLTEAGRIVLAHARTIVTEYDAIIDAFSGESGRGGALRIGVIPTILTNMLPAALMALRNRSNAPKVTVTSALSGDLVRAVERGELDAALIHQPTVLREGFVWREIARQKIVAIAPSGAPESDLPALLDAYPYIRFNRAAWVAPLIERRLAEMGLEPKTGAEIQSIEAIRLLVGHGFGVSILPSVGWAGPDEAAIRTLDFGAPPLFRTIGLLMRATLGRKRAARAAGDAFAQAARTGGAMCSVSEGCEMA